MVHPRTPAAKFQETPTLPRTESNSIAGGRPEAEIRVMSIIKTWQHVVVKCAKSKIELRAPHFNFGNIERRAMSVKGSVPRCPMPPSVTILNRTCNLCPSHNLIFATT
jgi:hypothetical protein